MRLLITAAVPEVSFKLQKSRGHTLSLGILNGKHLASFLMTFYRPSQGAVNDFLTKSRRRNT